MRRALFAGYEALFDGPNGSSGRTHDRAGEAC
jgi:hypothetical protein